MKHEDLDPITTTKDGGTVWKRYDGGSPVVTEPGNAPEQAPDGDAETYMTFADYQSFARNLRERAERLAHSIRNRAIAISAARLGPTDGAYFLMAHNWPGQSWMTPDQNDAARLILCLERQSWEPGRIADRVIARALRKLR